MPPSPLSLFKDSAPLNYCASETVCAWIMDDCRAGGWGEGGLGGGVERSGAETSLEVGRSGTQGDESSEEERERGRGGCCAINITKTMESEGKEGATPRATCGGGGCETCRVGDKMRRKSVKQAERGGKLLRCLMVYSPPPPPFGDFSKKGEEKLALYSECK